MQIKHDVKGQLAGLLATEDLIVEHRSVDTASFNVQTRVLTLPTWEKAGEDIDQIWQEADREVEVRAQARRKPSVGV